MGQHKWQKQTHCCLLDFASIVKSNSHSRKFTRDCQKNKENSKNSENKVKINKNTVIEKTQKSLICILEVQNETKIEVQINEFTGAFNPECVPNIDVKVIVSSHEQSAGLAKGHRGDPAYDVVVCVLSQLLVGSDVVQLDGGIVRARAESCPLREELREKGGNQSGLFGVPT